MPTFRARPVLSVRLLATGLLASGLATALLHADDPPAPVTPPVAPATPPESKPAQPPAEPADHVPIPSHWQGYVAAKGGTIFVRIDVTGTPAEPAIKITLPAAGAVRGTGSNPRIKDGQLAATLAARGVEGRFVGIISKDLQHYLGTLALGPAGTDNEVPFDLRATAEASEAANKTVWEGTLDAMGQKLPMAYTIADLGADGFVGSLDIPLQGVDRFPVMVTREADGGFTLVTPLGVDAIVKVKPEGDGKLVGTFQQATFNAPFTLTKVTDKATVVTARPQTPKPPFPYRTRDVVIRHRFGHSLAATLFLPERKPDSPAKFPAVVMVTGSGPQDRDETIMGHKPFLVIADALARAGIAVLRYDDRGVGGSTGSFESSTSDDFATDADEASEWLKTQPEIDADRIGIIGHSEGGIIAPMVAKWQWEGEKPEHPIAFVVLLAGPGVNGAKILELQMRKILEASGHLSPQEIDGICAAQKDLIEAVVAKADKATLEEKAKVLLTLQFDAAKKQGQPVPEGSVEQAVPATVQQMTSRWMVTFLTHEPAAWLAELRIPILSMHGELDTQVDPNQSVPFIEAASKVGGAQLTVRRYEHLNHLFQPAKTGSPEEYASIETTFDPKALQDMVDWIVAVTRTAPVVAPKPAAVLPEPAKTEK